MIENILLKRTPYDLRSLSKIIDASYATQDNRVEHIQKKTFSPSTVGYGHGQCPRYWFLGFTGEEFTVNHDAASVDTMKSGTDAHARIQENFMATGLDVECEIEITSSDPPIRGFVDLYLKNFNGFNIPIEVKTTRMEAFAVRQAKGVPPAYHEIQLLLYLWVMKEKYGLIMYENKNDYRKLLIPVEMTPENEDKIGYVLDWMRDVHKNYTEGNLPKKFYRKNAKQCKSCPLSGPCSLLPLEGVEIRPLDYEGFEPS